MSDQPGCPCSICDEDYMNQSDSRDSVGQSADLRTRIAAVLWNYFDQTRRDGYIVDGVDGDELADAVIEALNLDVAVTYLSVDKLRREFCVEGHYTVEVNDA